MATRRREWDTPGQFDNALIRLCALSSEHCRVTVEWPEEMTDRLDSVYSLFQELVQVMTQAPLLNPSTLNPISDMQDSPQPLIATGGAAGAGTMRESGFIIQDG